MKSNGSTFARPGDWAVMPWTRMWEGGNRYSGALVAGVPARGPVSGRVSGA